MRDHTYVHDDLFVSSVYKTPTVNDSDSCGLGQSLPPMLQDSLFVWWRTDYQSLELYIISVVPSCAFVVIRHEFLIG